MENQKRPKVTIVLAVVQVIVFFVLSFGGMTEDGAYMVEHGAMYVPYILEGKYYLLLTSIFLHFGFEHLMSNTVSLLVMGWNLEPVIGPVKLLILYLCSGIGGNLLSMALDIVREEYVVSAGASGAIFGMTGALLYVAYRYRDRVREISGRGMLFVVALSLYLGFTDSGVDNAAHVGGLVVGFVFALLFCRKCHTETRTVSR